MKKDIFTGFETEIASECGDAFGFDGIVPGSIVRQRTTDRYVITVGASVDGGYFCQIDNADDYTCQAIEYADTPEDAYRRAAVAAVVYDAMRDERNSEDAVNLATMNACVLVMMHHAPCTSEEFEEYDELMGIAREFVRRDCAEFGFEWEEF